MSYRPHDTAEAMADPDWDGQEKVHDWRNHVGGHVRAIWDTFAIAQKLAIAADAEVEALNEVWD